MFGLGFPEIIVILVIILLIFGAGKLPEIMGSIGKGIKDFKQAMKEPEKKDPASLPNNKDKEKRSERIVDKKIFIGVGSNIGNGVKNCMTAIRNISSNGRVNLKSISSFYTTSPVSEIKQDDFINCAVFISWEGTPGELLEFLIATEDSMGRTREIKDGPRIIDLDILLFDDAVLDEPSMTIPHKELHKRRFALIPCLEIDPNLVHPLYKKPLNDFLPDIGDDQVVTKLQGIAFLAESEGE